VIVISHGCQSDKGMVREENQDSYGLTPPTLGDLNTPKGVLFVVADGMGGHRAGRQASELAVATITSSYASAATTPVAELIRNAMGEANAAIYTKAGSDPAFRGMGTTCTVLVFQESSYWIGHIGDSKVFLITSDELRQVTTDHSRVWDLYCKGVITREQARVHPERNVLTRAMGKQADAAPDISGPLPLSAGMWFLMCTDGLTNHLEEEEIRRMVAGRAPQVAADELVALANARGGTDNVTVVIIRVAEG
jgi:serine/threonine protein phosphatase PrpC